VLRKKLFLVLMAEDRGQDAAHLRRLRWEFLASAVSEGWTLAQAAGAIGLSLAKAAELIARPIQ
jgi:hypothetical protein